MTPERADEINKALVAHSMYAMGLRADPPPSVAGYTLREMLDATDQVQAEDDAKPRPQTIRFVCDARLIAAIYTLAHYPPCPPSDAQAVAHNERAGVFVITCTPDREEET